MSPNTVPKSKGRPRRVKMVRRLIKAGFVVSYDEGLQWANRIRASRGESPLELGQRDYCTVVITLDDRVMDLGGVECNWFGPQDNTGFFHQFMAVTRCEEGLVPVVNGKRRLTPEQEQQGPDEEVAKKMLKDEGVQWEYFYAYSAPFPKGYQPLPVYPIQSQIAS